MLRSHNHRNRDYLRSDRAAKRNRRRMTFRLGLVIFIFVFLAVGMLIVTRIDAFAVKDISVEGNREVTSSELIDIAQVHASSSWLYFFPRKSIVLYPTKELEADIKAKFPRFSDVAINRSGLSSIRIRVIERSPRALWCDDVQSSCYTVDDQGYIYARADDSFATTSELIRFVGGNSSSTSSVIGTNINSSSTFSDIVSLLQGMKDRGLTPEQVEILRRWIEQGATWQKHWAFLPPERSPLPAVKNQGWARNPVDHFILAQLEREAFERR